MAQIKASVDEGKETISFVAAAIRHPSASVKLLLANMLLISAYVLLLLHKF